MQPYGVKSRIAHDYLQGTLSCRIPVENSLDIFPDHSQHSGLLPANIQQELSDVKEFLHRSLYESENYGSYTSILIRWLLDS